MKGAWREGVGDAALPGEEHLLNETRTENDFFFRRVG